MREEYKNILSSAKGKYGQTKLFFKKLRKVKGGELDLLFGEAHQKYSDQIDCLACANCCRGTGPLLKERDINRLAKTFSMKKGDFIDTYLQVDEDGDMIFQSLPCPFIDENNYCLVYEERPGACREYPHTDRHNIKKYLKPTLENYKICPIVYLAVEEIKEKLS